MQLNRMLQSLCRTVTRLTRLLVLCACVGALCFAAYYGVTLLVSPPIKTHPLAVESGPGVCPDVYLAFGIVGFHDLTKDTHVRVAIELRNQGDLTCERGSLVLKESALLEGRTFRVGPIKPGVPVMLTEAVQVKQGRDDTERRIPRTFQLDFHGRGFTVTNDIYPFLGAFAIPDKCEIAIGKAWNLGDSLSGETPWAKTTLLPTCRQYFSIPPAMKVMVTGAPSQSKTTLKDVTEAFLQGKLRYTSEGTATDAFSQTRGLHCRSHGNVVFCDTAGLSWTDSNAKDATDGDLRWDVIDVEDLLTGRFKEGNTPGDQRALRSHRNDYDKLSLDSINQQASVVTIVVAAKACLADGDGGAAVAKKVASILNRVRPGLKPIFLITMPNKVVDTYPLLANGSAAATPEGLEQQEQLIDKCAATLGARQNMRVSFHYNGTGSIPFEAQVGQLQYLRMCQDEHLSLFNRNTGISPFFQCVGVVATLVMCWVIWRLNRPANNGAAAVAAGAPLRRPNAPRPVVAPRRQPPTEASQYDRRATPRDSGTASESDYLDRKDPVELEHTWEDLEHVTATAVEPLRDGEQRTSPVQGYVVS